MSIKDWKHWDKDKKKINILGMIVVVLGISVCVPPLAPVVNISTLIILSPFLIFFIYNLWTLRKNKKEDI